MKRINLKELRDALNNIPDEELELLFITHPYAVECDSEQLSLIYAGDEYPAFFEKYEVDVIQSFVDGIIEDSAKINEVAKDPDMADEYSDDFPESN